MNDPLHQPLLQEGYIPLQEVLTLPRVTLPFIGLRPFDEDDTPFFYGRREQTDELLQRLYRTRFVAVVGSSGCGKSSLVRAGLIPALKAGFLVADRDLWAVFKMKPGDRPLRNLAAELLPADAGEDALDDLAEEIRLRGDAAVLERLQPALHKDRNILIVVDQFEETFRFGLRGDAEHRDEATDFTSILLELGQEPGLPLYVVLTMRSDFMGDCDAFPGFAEAMNQSMYLVPRLTRQQLCEAIEGPIRMVGASISQRLLDRLLNESDRASDQLPVLQHALMRTWEEWREDEKKLADETDGGSSVAGLLGRPLRKPPIGLEHYVRAGSLSDALNKHANEALGGLDLSLTRKIFQALTDVDAANREIRRPAKLSVLEEVTGAPRQAIVEILERFRSDNRCFVVLSGTPGDSDPLVDLSHESLIRRWDTLAQWVREEAESASIYRRLEESTARYPKQEGLWSDPQLQEALDWKEKHEVDETWAAWAMRVRPAELFRATSWERPSLAQVLAFLEKSRKARDDEQERRAAQERDLLLAEERREKLALLAQERKEKLAQAQELADSRQRWVRWMATISAVAVICAVGAGTLMYQRGRSLFSSKLTRQSEELAATNPQLSLLLAAEALGKEPPDLRKTRAAENALRKALIQTGGLGLGGHSKDVSSLEVSPDGSILVSGALDGTVRRWDLSSPHPELTSKEVYKTEDDRRLSAAADSPSVHVAAAGGRVAYSTSNGSVYIDGWNEPVKEKVPDISALTLSQDGRWLVAGDASGKVWVWELAGRTARAVHPAERGKGRIVMAQVSADGRWLVTVSAGEKKGSMTLWALKMGHPPEIKTALDNVAVADLNGNWLALGSLDSTARLWRLEPEGPLPIWKSRYQSTRQEDRREAPIQAIRVSSKGIVATASYDGSMGLWSVAGQPASLLSLPPSMRDLVTDLRISPNGWLAAVFESGFLRLWRPDHWVVGQEIHLLRGHHGGVSKVSFTPDGRWFLTGGADGTIRRWDLDAPDPSNADIRHPGEQKDLRAIALSPNARWLVTGSDTDAILWDLNKGGGHSLVESDLSSVKFSDDGRWLVTSEGGPPAQRRFQLRRLESGAGPGVRELAHTSAVDIGSKWLAIGRSDNGSIEISGLDENAPSASPFLTLTDSSELVESIVVTRDRRFVVVSRENGTVQIWRTQGGSKVFEDKLGSPRITVSGDSRWLALVAVPNEVEVWKLTDSPIKTQIKSSCSISRAVFGKDGRLFLGCVDGSVTSYIPTSEEGAPKFERERNFAGQKSEITLLGMSPRGRFLVTGASDGDARVWDLERPDTEPLVMAGDGKALISSIFEKDDRSLLTVSVAGTARRWHLFKKDLLAKAELTVGRNLSQNEWCKYLRRTPFSFYRRTFEDLPPMGGGRDCSTGETD